MTTIKRMLKSFSSCNLIPTSPLSNSDTLFFKINPVSKPNTEGKSPIIIYNKKKKMPNIFDLNLREMGYVTDGGLKKKQQRFDGTKAFSKQGISLICTPKQNTNFPLTPHLSKGQLCQSMKDIKPKKMSNIKPLGKSTPKGQKMGCFDRKSLTVRGSHVNSPSSCSQRRCLSPELKYEQMDELVKKAIAYKFKEFTIERGKKTREEEINERKQKYLEENGVEIQMDSLENENNSNANNYSDSALEKNKRNNNNEDPIDLLQSSHPSNRLTKSNHQFNNSNSQFQSPSLINKERISRSGSYNNINDEMNKAKRILKPRVDHFEFINKINNEARRMSNHIRNNSAKSPIDNNNNSFRKSSSSNKQHISDSVNHSHLNHIDNKSKHLYHHINNMSNSNSNGNSNSHNNSNFNLLSSYQSPSHHRSEEELAYFTLSKKIQKHEREQKEVIENNKKLFMIYRNLSSLFQKLQFKPSKSQMKKKSKIKNDFYIGKTSSDYTNVNMSNIDDSYCSNSSNNNSTIIDPDDFYCSVIEGQKLIVKSDIEFEREKKRRQNLINCNGNTIINRNNIKKEQIKKITKEFSNNSTNNNQSTNQFSELKQRAMNTILRTNDLLSHENIELLFKSDKGQIKDSKVQQKEKEKEMIMSNKGKKIQSKHLNDNEEEKDKERENQYEDSNLNDNDNNNDNAQGKDTTIHHSKSNKSTKLEVVIDDNNYTMSYNGTKEKNLPSLSHTYTINNTNTNNKRIIEPRAVLNLVEIIKILMQRKIFYMFYEDYFNEAMIQRYTIAFVYFNALLKQRTFHRIACFANYKLEYYAFTQLFKPFIKRAFHEFVSRCNYIEKIKYLRELLLHIIKKKSIERIYVYGYIAKSLCDIFSKLMPRPMIQDAFRVFIHKALISNIKTSEISKEQSKAKKDISSDKILDERLQTVSSGHSVDSDEKSYIKKKMNTYAYESSLLKSEYSVEPNSVDSDRLHRLHMMILEHNERIIGEDEYENRLALDLENKKRTRPRSANNSLQNSNSAKSAKSLKDICLLKPGIDLSRSHDSLEETIKKSRSNKALKKALSDRTNDSGKGDKSHHSSLRLSIDENMSKEDNELNTSSHIKKKIEEKDSKTKTKEEEEKNKQSLVQVKKGNEIKDKEEYEDNEIIAKRKRESNPISIELDISAEKDLLSQIEWELSLGNQNITEKKTIIEDEPKSIKLSKDIGNLNINPSDQKIESKSQYEKDINIDIEQLSPIKKEKPSLTDKSNSNGFIPQSPSTPLATKREMLKEQYSLNKKQSNSSNNNSYINDFEKESISEIEEPDEDNIVSLIQSETKQQEGLSAININELTETIISQLLSEIKDQSIVPHKVNKFDIIPIQTNNSNSFTSSSHNLSHQSLSQLTESTYNNLLMNYTALSLFSKTVKDKKKEQSLNLYMNKIYPRLIAKIKEEIRSNYSTIYNNLSTPIRSIPQGLMTSLALEDAEMLRDNFKRLQLTEDEFQMLNKAKILSEFEETNKKIRSKDNVASDNYYDNLLNECIIDTAIELLNQERLYGESGEPLPWSTRIRELEFKYSKTDPTKLIALIENVLFALLNQKIGMISENFDYMEQDQLNNEREKRLLSNILIELNETEHQWINLEMEETQIKIEANELIIEQLYHEVIEIIEHIQYSRKHPEFYQHKSIYACEDIPKLTCQITSDENKEEENEFMNM